MSDVLDKPAQNYSEESIWPTVTRYGVIGSLVFIIYSLVTNLVGFGRPSGGFIAIFANLGIIITIGITIMAIAANSFKKEHGRGAISFNQAFKVALLTAVFVLLVTTAFNYFYMTFIEPDLVETLKEETIEMMETYDLPQEQIDASLERFDTAYSLKSQLQNMGWSVIFNAFIAAIIGLIIKKEPEQLQFNE